MSPTLYAAPPSPAEPPPLSTPTVVAPIAGVPVVTPSVPAFPAKFCSYAVAVAQMETPIPLPIVPAVLAAHSPTEACPLAKSAK